MWLCTILFLSFVVGRQCEKNAADCLAKEKSRGVLDFAKESINKAKDLLPNCSDSSNSSECGAKEKAIAFLEIATDLITEAENNYPTCNESKPVIIPTVKSIDCTDLLRQGNNQSGVYEVWPRSRFSNDTSIKAYCDMETDGGGWIVVQRRGGFSQLQNFDQTWENFKKGFGDLEKEFWLGNDYISMISNQGNYEVRFDLEDFQAEKRYAVYKSFRVEDEAALYKLHISNYTGTAGDSMSYSNGYAFSTKDRVNDNKSCATSRGTGFWFKDCTRGNINGVPTHDTKPNTKYLYWNDWKSDYFSLAKADMKLRRI